MAKGKPAITVQFNVKLDPKLSDDIDRCAHRLGVTKAQFADAAFRAHIEANKKEPKK